jgi:hypothetical protein
VKVLGCVHSGSVRSTSMCRRFSLGSRVLRFWPLLFDTQTAFALGVSPLRTSCLEPPVILICGLRVNPIPNSLQSSLTLQRSGTRQWSRPTSNLEQSVTQPSTSGPPQRQLQCPTPVPESNATRRVPPSYNHQCHSRAPFSHPCTHFVDYLLGIDYAGVFGQKI